MDEKTNLVDCKIYAVKVKLCLNIAIVKRFYVVDCYRCHLSSV